ncbi:MAG: hypothetical protein DVB23_002551 [Verrucomicrobia bacterium]|nr:MAG: hypothetical protein DVB23_002551 [Verrucomicrobiota bacterium]
MVKISGGFRFAEGSAAFADLRRVISTPRKAGRAILDTLKRMFESRRDLNGYEFRCQTDDLD